MYWVLAPLIFLGTVALGAQPGSIIINTETTGVNNAAGVASVPGKGFITDTVVGPGGREIKPPKGLPSTGGKITITSNSNASNGNQTNEVSTKIQDLQPAPRPAPQPAPQPTPQPAPRPAPNSLNIPPIPPITFTNRRSSARFPLDASQDIEDLIPWAAPQPAPRPAPNSLNIPPISPITFTNRRSSARFPLDSHYQDIEDLIPYIEKL